MFDTAAQIGLSVAMVLPGFLVVRLSERRRPSSPTGGDVELVLRGLVYALLIQSVGVLTQWLPSIIEDLGGPQPEDHYDAAVIYALTLCVAVPTGFGLVLGHILRSAESRGSLEWWHYALGGRDARRAWDYAFSQHDGAWVRVHLSRSTISDPVALLGKYGKQSWAAQSPANPDLYLQEAWITDRDGKVSETGFLGNQKGPGTWIDGAQIERIEFLMYDDAEKRTMEEL